MTLVLSFFALPATIATLTHNRENIDKLEDLEKVAECMDEWTQFADGLVLDELETKKGNLKTQLIMWVIILV